MANAQLRFKRPARDPGPLHLRLGGEGTAAPASAELSLHGRVTGLRGHLRAGALAPAALHGRITGLRGHLGAGHDSNTDRPLRASHLGRHQHAGPGATANAARWREAPRASAAQASHWQDTQTAGAAHAAHWRASPRRAVGNSSHWQNAQPAGRADAGRYQQAMAHTAASAGHYQDARSMGLLTLARYPQARRLATLVGGRIQDAMATGVILAAAFRRLAARRLATEIDHYQDARRPPPGASARADPPSPPICHDPRALARLRFKRPAHPAGPPHLRFVCGGAGPVEPELPAAIIVIARRRSYIMLTSLEVIRADNGQPLPTLVDGFSMQLDRRSWTWDFSLNLHAVALPLIQPEADGTPRELEVKVNGQPFRMLAESYSRHTQHPRSVLRISGRGKGAFLDAPFADVRTFTQPAARTAQQLMLDVLTINGVSNGWALDWQLTDWPIPADTWAHQGTWISAINDIAASVGAYVQPHDTAQVLRILPAYPVRSWELASAAPDIELPPGIASVEEVDWLTKPACDALYMQGEPGTHLFFRKRAGTAGASLAPMVVHPLLVHADAAAQRAVADLSDAGRQVLKKLKLPVLPATGIIKPGKLVRYTDDGQATRTGIVRAVSVNSGEARIDQTIEVQAHE